MDKDKVIKWVDELIESYRWESEMNINERSSEAQEEVDDLNAECEKMKKEFRFLLDELVNQ